ncbi:MAG: hypothetical protein JHC31_07960 [Sulfurihydrogenibium sp.]|jgi:hypothetical protein|nr:hypothetical protein [Sulfurihydrogenibium sp.]
MKIKGILITKQLTSKGNYVYNFLTRDEDNQIVIRLLSKNDYSLNKEVELSVNVLDYKKMYFEKSK